jgi:hypothetical protein
MRSINLLSETHVCHKSYRAWATVILYLAKVNEVIVGIYTIFIGDIMRITNFRDRIKVGDYIYASIDVKRNFWQATKPERIFKIGRDGGNWLFLDAGVYTSDYTVEKLELAYLAKATLESASHG